MQFHFDSEIHVRREVEFASLYPWYLVDSNERLKQGAKKYVPWEWAFTFEAKHVDVRKSISSERGGFQKKQTSVGPIEVRDSVVATLQIHSESDTQFSMFGTKRQISEFGLQIIPTESASDSEGCSSWGCVSNTSEVDFEHLTTNDVVEFTVFLSRDKFDAIADGINLFGMRALTFRISGVGGFYAEWSPSIRTPLVKVLTPGSDQKIHDKEGTGIVPERLGEVESWAIHLNKISASSDGEVASKAEFLQPSIPQSPPKKAASNLAVLFPLWVIVGLLLLIWLSLS